MIDLISGMSDKNPATHANPYFFYSFSEKND